MGFPSENMRTKIRQIVSICHIKSAGPEHGGLTETNRAPSLLKLFASVRPIQNFLYLRCFLFIRRLVLDLVTCFFLCGVGFRAYRDDVHSHQGGIRNLRNDSEPAHRLKSVELL